VRTELPIGAPHARDIDPQAHLTDFYAFQFHRIGRWKHEAVLAAFRECCSRPSDSACAVWCGDANRRLGRGECDRWRRS
jgi:hypothetical protein